MKGLLSGRDLEVIHGFLEEHYEDFQLFLEDKHEIEGTEGERFLDALENEIK